MKIQRRGGEQKIWKMSERLGRDIEHTIGIIKSHNNKNMMEVKVR